MKRGLKGMEYQYDKTPLSGIISDYDVPIRLHKVDETKYESLWDEIVNTYHYLGYGGVIGGRIKYIVTLGNQIIGAISFCSAAYHLGPRDEYVGWDKKTRIKMLPHLVCNNRFLILPWIKIYNLASGILSLSLRRLREDWKKQYEVVPYMVETYVDNSRYEGTCYKASNWIYLGQTKGYGKVGDGYIYHGQKKDIYVAILDNQLTKQFKPDSSRVNLMNEREELISMINGIPMFSLSLLKEVGIKGNPTEEIKERFADHLSRFMPYLGRKEHKQHLITMIQGFLSELDRKSIEPIAIAFEGIDEVRNLTNFMTKSKWDNSGMLSEYRKDVSELIAHEDSMITGDGSDFPKKGTESVGVARQYCGRTGKIDNCQAGVFCGYAGPNGYALIDYELYMPKQWFDDEYEDKRTKCKVPKELEFKTKNEILSDMICSMIKSGQFPAKYVGVDSSFGNDSKFLDSLPEEIIYFADIHNDLLVFDEYPDVFLPEYSGKGRRPIKMTTNKSPMQVKDLVEQSDIPWEPVVLGIGAKGPIVSEDKCIRVFEVRNGLPGNDIWLYARKFENKTIKYALCNLPVEASIDEIRKPALMRWSIEQCFNECKQYLGMDHYEARSWVAWHRHILLTLIAHLFIIKLRMAYSSTPNAPNPTPYNTAPVSIGDYLQAHAQLISNQDISHPNILSMPNTPQQFMTIGLIRKLISAVFPPVAAVLIEIGYRLYKASVAFQSHSLATVEKAIEVYG